MKYNYSRAIIVFMYALALASSICFAVPSRQEPTSAQTVNEESVKPIAPWPVVESRVAETIKTLLENVLVQQAMKTLQEDNDQALQETIVLCEIPAPPFGEQKKAEAFLKMLQASGLSDAKIDKEGNVVGIRKGVGKGPTLVVCAHLDTVFPIETKLKVELRDGKYYCPGITDDTRGLAVLLSWLRALNAANIQTVGDLIFVGSVGEEGNGDLRGIKAFFREHKNIDGYVGIEPLPMGVASTLNPATIRYEVTYTAPGGHSYAAFGEVPSAIHALGRAIAKISDIQTPVTPRTTFTVGVISGGTSVNTIAPNAKMEIDIRSDDMKQLRVTEKQILDAIAQSVEEENKRWGTNTLTFSLKKIGDRPGGMTPNNSVIVQTSLAAMNAMDQKEIILKGESTDAGVPISLGIPAITLPPGGKHSGFHALDESFDPTDAYKGAQIGLTTVLSLAGVNGVSQPLLVIRDVK